MSQQARKQIIMVMENLTRLLAGVPHAKIDSTQLHYVVPALQDALKEVLDVTDLEIVIEVAEDKL
jgi:hypothetical protein